MAKKRSNTRKKRAANSTPNPVEQTVVKTKLEKITYLRAIRDMAGWLLALRTAEDLNRPDRRRLYSHYQKIVKDPHVIAVTGKVKARCTNSRIWWKVDGKRADLSHPVNRLLEKSYFTQLVELMLESKWWGHSLIQLNFLTGGFNPETDEGVELVHRPNVRPEYGDILPKAGDESNRIEFRRPPYTNFLVEIGGRRDLGLLSAVVPEVMFKKHGVSTWADFLEIYGVPPRSIAYDANVTGQREEALKVLEEQGRTSGVAHPKGSEFAIHETAKAGNSEAFKVNADFHNKEISKVFLLSTMTLEDGSSRSQSDTHQDSEDEAIWAYQLFIEFALTEKLKPILHRHGWQVEENGKFQFGDTERLKKTAMADILAKLSAICDIPMSFIYEFFNIPEPGPGDKVKSDVARTSRQPDIQTKSEKKKLTADNGQLSIAPCCDPIYTNVSLAYDPAPVSKEEQGILKKIWESKLTDGKIPRNHFNALYSLLVDGVEEGYGKVEEEPDHLRRSLLEANVARFSAARDIAMVKELNAIKNRADSFRQFKEEAKGVLANFNENYLKTEYGHAVAVSQAAAAYLRHLDEKDEFPYWEYQTVGDDRVRQAHAALDGMVFQVGDTDALRFYPPNGYNCRCEAIQKEDLGGKELQTLDKAIRAIGGEAWEAMQKKGFDTNWGDALQVFSRNQEYINSFRPNGLDYRTFLLLPFRDMKALKALKTKPMDGDAARKWFDARKGDHDLDSADAVRLLDHRGRHIELTKDTLEMQVVKNEAQLIQHIETTLKKSDEHWLLEQNGFRRRYLKFYKGKAMAITVVFGKGQPERVWSVSLIEGDGIDGLRKGILIED